MRTLKLRARSQTMLALDYVVGEEAAGGQLICDVVGLFLYGPSRAVRRPRGDHVHRRPHAQLLQPRAKTGGKWRCERSRHFTCIEATRSALAARSWRLEGSIGGIVAVVCAVKLLSKPLRTSPRRPSLALHAGPSMGPDFVSECLRGL